MNKIIVSIIVLFFVCLPSFALGDFETINNEEYIITYSIPEECPSQYYFNKNIDKWEIKSIDGKAYYCVKALTHKCSINVFSRKTMLDEVARIEAAKAEDVKVYRRVK
jgi:hypothetical protein